MKAIIAYALVVIGVTQFVGMLVGSLISLPIAMLLPHGPMKMRVVPLLEFFNGAAALAAGLALFWLLSVPISFCRSSLARGSPSISFPTGSKRALGLLPSLASSCVGLFIASHLFHDTHYV